MVRPAAWVRHRRGFHVLPADSRLDRRLEQLGGRHERPPERLERPESTAPSRRICDDSRDRRPGGPSDPRRQIGFLGPLASRIDNPINQPAVVLANGGGPPDQGEHLGPKGGSPHLLAERPRRRCPAVRDGRACFQPVEFQGVYDRRFQRRIGAVASEHTIPLPRVRRDPAESHPGRVAAFLGLNVPGPGRVLTAIGDPPRQLARAVTHRTTDPHLGRAVRTSFPLPAGKGLRLKAEHLGGLLPGQQPVVRCRGHFVRPFVSCPSPAVNE